MRGEDIFLGQNDLGKIIILLNSLEKSGFREKRKKKLVTLFLVTPLPALRRYRVLLTTLTFADVKFTSIVHV